MKELGAWLQEARLAKNLSLEEIAEATKIRVTYLQAIEEGNLEKLPTEEVYLRAFLRSYAQAVGLDPKNVLLRYDFLRHPIDPEERLAKRARRARNLRHQRIIAAIIAILFILAVYLMYQDLLS